jgi:peptide/nickel transport system permease protein
MDDTAPDLPLHTEDDRLGLAFWLSVTWLLLLAGAAVCAAWLPLPDPEDQDLHNQLADPLTSGHILGTDGLGRDLLSRLLHGSATTLTISGVAVAVGTVLGGTLGLAAGYLRGPVDAVVGWLSNVVLAFPSLVLLLLFVAVAGRTMPPIIIGIAVLSAPAYARVARATALKVSENDHVLAAKVLGARRRRILRTEILPEVARPLAAFALVMLGVVIVLETSLAFLGLSVDSASWGETIAHGRSHLPTAAHPVVAPSVLVFLTVFSTNVVGDTLRNLYD